MSVLSNFECLLTDTRSVLEQLIASAPFLKGYVLVGGFSLALHIYHRKSEDLDFFTYHDHFDSHAILVYIKRFTQREIVNHNSDQLDLLLNGVKITFFNVHWPFLTPNPVHSFNLASLKA